MIANVVELLAEVQRRGVTLVAEADRLRFTPRDRLPAELVGRLKEHKAEVIAALRIKDEPRPCALCGSAISWLTTSGATICPGCNPKPVDAIRKLLIVTIDGRNQWADFETEREAVRQRRDQVSITACIDDKST